MSHTHIQTATHYRMNRKPLVSVANKVRNNILKIPNMATNIDDIGKNSQYN